MACSSSSNQQQSVPVKKCVAIKIVCNEIDDVRDELSSLEVDIALPLSYPTASAICQDDIQATNNGEVAEALSKKLSAYLEQFTGCECIELIIGLTVYQQAMLCIAHLMTAATHQELNVIYSDTITYYQGPNIRKKRQRRVSYKVDCYGEHQA